MSAAAPANVNNIIVIACVALAVLAALGYWYTTKRKLDAAKEQAAIKQEEANKLDAIIKDVESYQKRKDNLQKRIDLINQLKQNQKGPVRVMDRISQDLPDLVWLDNMTMNGGLINIRGRGLNPNAIALFIENIKNDPLFEEPQTDDVSQVQAAPLVYGFNMSFRFTYAPKTDASGTAGATSTSGTTMGSTGTTGTVSKK